MIKFIKKLFAKQISEDDEYILDVLRSSLITECSTDCKISESGLTSFYTKISTNKAGVEIYVQDHIMLGSAPSCIITLFINDELAAESDSKETRSRIRVATDNFFLERKRVAREKAALMTQGVK